jgi:hypothetical protein
MEQERDFGCGNGHEHVNDEWNCGKPHEQTQKHQCAADDFHDSDKRGHDFRCKDANLYEPADAQSLRGQELLNPFGEKDSSDHQPDENCTEVKRLCAGHFESSFLSSISRLFLDASETGQEKGYR